MSSQVLFKVKASDINVLTSPLDFQCLSANLLIVRSHFHLIWGCLVIMSFIEMFSSEQYIKCLYICL